jgi:hypothetical protein
MRKEVVDSIHEIVNEIPKINKSTHYIFLHRRNIIPIRDVIYRELDAYGTSTDMVNFREEVV